MMKKINYKKSGVDIKKADEFVKGIRGFFPKDKINKISAFGSFFDLKAFLKIYKDPVLVSSTDGVGTKLKIAQSLGIHNTVGVDLVAMNVNDIVCLGAKPLFFLDYIACGKLDVGVLTKVMQGVKKGLKESDCQLIGGETAEMPGMYKKEEYDLAGFCVGIVDRKKIINGKNIKEGDVVIGLASSGLHSNGFSLARKALGKNGIKKYAKELLKPTSIYVKPILSLLTAYSLQLKAIKGIAHITGGAFYNKATKVLPKGLGMTIDKGSWKIPHIFKVIQKQGNVSEKEMYSVFNMGIGMIVIVDKKHVKKVMANLSKKCKAYIIGEIVKTRQKMTLI